MAAVIKDSVMEIVSDEDSVDSDEELQEALAAGMLKPGLNSVVEAKKKIFANNVKGMRLKLREFEKGLPWIERLDMVNKPAPLAPELAAEELEHRAQREKALKLAKQKITEDDPVHNDFKREMLFYRQAQAAVLEAIPRLKSMGKPTKRPTDYFAQMAKTDVQMNKIREKLISKQVVEERIEKIRKLRDLKKFGKKVQVDVQQKRQKEKKEMLDEVKKFRKGQVDSIGFLNDETDSKSKKNKGKTPFEIKKNAKNKKFGFGGKKSGLKKNTKSSTNDVDGLRYKKAPEVTKKKGVKRLGKSRRKKNKK